MSFLNPVLLFWLIPLAGLPLLIHLLNKRFPRLFLFSSVENIRQTIAQRSKLFRLRHLILLLLRTAFLSLLLIAFLKPVLPRFGSNATSKGARYVLIALDHSLSMEYKGEGLPLRKRAILEAEKILDALGPDDLVNVMLVEQSPQTCFVDFSGNHAEAKRFIESLKPGLSRADINQANAASARLLSKYKSKSELYYISDFQRKNWANADFSSLPANARLFFVDVATKQHENHAVLGAAVDAAQILAGEAVTLSVDVGNFTAHELNDRLKVLLDNRASFEKEISVPPWSDGKITLPITAGGPGLHLCEISLPEDDLPQDDRRFLALDVLEKEEIVIVSDDPDAMKSGLYFLQTALNPYENQQGSLLPRKIRSAEISPIALAGAKKIFLTRTDKFTEPACVALAKFLFQGGGAVYFLDGQSDRENLEQLEKAVGSGTMPLKLATHQVAENLSAAQQISKGDFKSRYLKLFRGSNRQNLALLEFYDCYRAASTGSGNVLLCYADDSPAMASFGYGLGTMLLMNFSVSEFSSNLARQRLFPAWIQEIVKNLSAEQSLAPNYVVGDVVTSEIWRNELKENNLKAPAGTAVNIKKEAVGDRFAISFTPEQAGFYTLARASEKSGAPEAQLSLPEARTSNQSTIAPVNTEKLLHAYAVNTSPDEADLRAIDKSVLPDTLASGQQAHFVEGRRDYEDLILGRPIFHWFVFAAVLFLLFEMTFQWGVRRLAR